MNKRKQLEMTVQDHLGFIGLLQEARANKLLARFAINRSQFTLLFLLGTDVEDSWTITMLTKHLEMKLPGVSKIVKHLNQQGWLQVKASTADRRQKIVELTAAGIQARGKILTATAPFIKTTFADWATSELEHFCQHLEKHKRWLDEHREPQ